MAVRRAAGESISALARSLLPEGSDPDSLRKCLAFDAILAWRVLDLARTARVTPDTPARDFLSDTEVAALYSYVTWCRLPRPPPDDVLIIRRFVIDITRPVGFRPSKRQPLPGTQLI